MTLMKALISKMETMDAEIQTMRKSMNTPELLLKRAGFVRANTPANEDVWGDPLRGERDSVISKAAAAIDDAGMSMPETNEAWHDMSWDDIHAMANTAAQAPDVDELIKQANELIEKAEAKGKKLGSTTGDSFESVRGVDKVRPGTYWTNQQQIEVEDVKNEGAKMEKNPKLKTHAGWPNVVEMRENKAGDPSDKNPEGAYNLTDFY
jgi:hypothetical protein